MSNQGLNVSDIVQVNVNLQSTGASVRDFDVALIAGDSDVINPVERTRQYADLPAVAEDFDITSPEYLAAQIYFDAPEPPALLEIGRWLRTASSGLLNGGILSATQQQITNFNNITNGGFDISIDGTPQDLTGLNFSATTNLNGVASVINGTLTGATCAWDGQKFSITSDSTGAGAYASGTITLNTAPSNADTVTIDGTAIEFVSASPTGNEVLIVAGDPVATAANLQAFLLASTDTNLLLMNYSRLGDVITVTSKLIGTAGNSYTLAKSSTHITLSGATLTSGAVPSAVGWATAGSGTDISTLLQLTQALAGVPVPGFNAETPLQAAVALYDADSLWYGLEFGASVQPSQSDYVAVAGFIESTSGAIARIFGITTQASNTVDPTVSNDLCSTLKSLGYKRTLTNYSTSSLYAVSAIFGDMFSVNFNAQNSTITVMFKPENGVQPELLTETEARTLKTKRCNAFVQYQNDTAIIQNGVMEGPAYIDEIWGLDWFQNAVQTAVFNLFVQSPKIPQTDAGGNQIINTIAKICAQAVNNGLVAPGVWNAPGFGQLSTGDFLKTGFYIYIQPIALQDESDRANRIAPPITIALKLAGAIQQVTIQVNVNR